MATHLQEGQRLIHISLPWSLSIFLVTQVRKASGPSASEVIASSAYLPSTGIIASLNAGNPARRRSSKKSTTVATICSLSLSKWRKCCHTYSARASSSSYPAFTGSITTPAPSTTPPSSPPPFANPPPASCHGPCRGKSGLMCHRRRRSLPPRGGRKCGLRPRPAPAAGS